MVEPYLPSHADEDLDDLVHHHPNKDASRPAYADLLASHMARRSSR